MKKLAATLFVALFFSGVAFSQPTLTIVTETPGLPSELFYGANCAANPASCTKIKPVRMRPPGATLPYYCVGAANTPITIDDCDFFVQQQYIDFLKRFPEAGADNTYGTSDDPMRFYLDIITRCSPTDTECKQFIRGLVSTNFFRSPEFQRKGNYVMYLYMISIGQRPVTAAELQDSSKVERPHYAEFMADLASISTPNDDPALTNQKKDQLAQNWMTRPEMASYPTDLNQFAQALANKAGVTLSSSTQSAIASATTRPQVLRIIAESQEVDTKFNKQSFVTMEYFGYLRREPEDCHNQANWGGPDANQCGFIFHNRRFLLSNDEPFIQNIIVRGFIESPEYRGRF